MTLKQSLWYFQIQTDIQVMSNLPGLALADHAEKSPVMTDVEITTATPRRRVMRSLRNTKRSKWK